MDDPFVSCPYVPEHRVPRSRLQGHIVKCEKKYPMLKICPYNATHRCQELAMIEHVKVCPSREEVFQPNQPEKTGAMTRPKPNLHREYLPETDPRHEIWDD